MTTPVRILLLEDNPIDAKLLALHLTSEQWEHDMVWVKSEAEFSAALDRGGFDIILSDSSGPFFDGNAALALARVKCPSVPYIVLSGAATPEAVAQAAQNGAAGYVLKDKLPLLIPCMERGLGKNV